MANRLLQEKSPYLLQHAHNPVDWYPWGEEAFEKARVEDKPVFLSVGYSTCHWCHVMEHESFENESIAALLNSKFVPIKVDREERPDVDRVYMTALQAMGGSGGWPMTMFLTPSLKPFYGGTYFPPEQRYGRIGLPELLGRISDVWTAERNKVEESASNITAFLEDASHAIHGKTLPGSEVLDRCYEQLHSTFDQVNAGFGNSAKFPRPVTLEFLLRYYARTGVREALTMAQKTLDAMAHGGIRDHLGGGFHRYSVDPEWRVPHFEKMLYDQAQLISVFLNGYLLTGRKEYAGVVRSTVEYLLRDLRDAGGGFFSAEDADSARPDHPGESGEGAFYLWTKQELLETLGEHDGKVFALWYGVEDDGNAAVDPQHEFLGKNILYVSDDSSTLSKIVGLAEADLDVLISRCREKLLALRSSRPRPFRDEKILTAWNGLAISALVRAGSILFEQAMIEAAGSAAEFVLKNLRAGASGSLLRRYSDGEARFEGHLEDYAFLVQGLLDLFEATGKSRWLTTAKALTERMITLFHDSENGGFFETGTEDRSVIARLKEHYDGAEPSGNSIAILNLLRLATLVDKADWRIMGERSLAAFSTVLEEQPVAMPNMASALDRLLGPSSEIVLVGRQRDVGTKELEREIRGRYLPHTVIVPVDPEVLSDEGDLNALARGLSMVEGRPAAYVCENFACNLPATDPQVLGTLLDKLEGR